MVTRKEANQDKDTETNLKTKVGATTRLEIGLEKDAPLFIFDLLSPSSCD